MPLEKFFSGEQPINVKDLTIENPEKEEEGLPFDPEREMTEEEWEKVKDFLETGGFPYANASTAMVSRMCPGKIDKFEIEMAEKELRDDGEDLLKDLDDRRSRTRVADPGHILQEGSTLYGMKILTPDLFRKLATRERVERYAHAVLSFLREARLSFPEIVMARELIERKKIDEAAQGIWESEKETADTDRANEWWATFVARAASLRLLFPERFPELKVDRTVWESIRNAFHERMETRGSTALDGITLSDLVLALKTLAAEEIKLKEDGGFELIMSKPKPEPDMTTPEMPEYRNF